MSIKSDLVSNAGTGPAPATTGQQQSPSLTPPRSPWRRIESYTVQQAAILTGLSEHTLRYYEKIGLIQPVQRQESSGHRRYGPDDLAKLETLACLRATGMPIDQMRRYFELRSDSSDHANATALQELLSEHLHELRRRMAALQTHARYVELKIGYWRAVEAHDEQTAANLAREAQEIIHAAIASSD